MFTHPKNPRKQLIIDDLTDSIVESGQLVPILVRLHGEGYQIISGHRRKAALERAGILKADCDVVEMDDEQAYKALMVTNIQAQTLSEIEEAEGIRYMMDSFEWSQQRVSVEFGKSQKWVSFRLSFLNLDEMVKDNLSTRVLTPTHAREIAQLPIEIQTEVANKVIDEGLSTRETADLVKRHYPNRATSDGLDNVTTTLEPDIPTVRQSNAPTSAHFEIPQQKEDVAVMERIKLGSELILNVKTLQNQIFPHSWVIESLIEFNRADEAVKTIDKLKEHLDYLRLHITNAQARLNKDTQVEGKILEFKRS